MTHAGDIKGNSQRSLSLCIALATCVVYISVVNVDYMPSILSVMGTVHSSSEILRCRNVGLDMNVERPLCINTQFFPTT